MSARNEPWDMELWPISTVRPDAHRVFDGGRYSPDWSLPDYPPDGSLRTFRRARWRSVGVPRFGVRSLSFTVEGEADPVRLLLPEQDAALIAKIFSEPQTRTNVQSDNSAGNSAAAARPQEGRSQLASFRASKAWGGK